MSDYRVPIPDEIEKTLRDIAQRIGGALPSGWGFALLIFTFGKDGKMTWISNADRADMILALQEFIQKQSS